jgi:hypothetical protein
MKSWWSDPINAFDEVLAPALARPEALPSPSRLPLSAPLALKHDPNIAAAADPLSLIAAAAAASSAPGTASAALSASAAATSSSILPQSSSTVTQTTLAQTTTIVSTTLYGTVEIFTISVPSSAASASGPSRRLRTPAKLGDLYWSTVYCPHEMTSLDEVLAAECVRPRELRLHSAPNKADVPERIMAKLRRQDQLQQLQQQRAFLNRVEKSVASMARWAARSEIVAVRGDLKRCEHWWLVLPGTSSAVLEHQPSGSGITACVPPLAVAQPIAKAAASGGGSTVASWSTLNQPADTPTGTDTGMGAVASAAAPTPTGVAIMPTHPTYRKPVVVSPTPGGDHSGETPDGPSDLVSKVGTHPYASYSASKRPLPSHLSAADYQATWLPSSLSTDSQRSAVASLDAVIQHERKTAHAHAIAAMAVAASGPVIAAAAATSSASSASSLTSSSAAAAAADTARFLSAGATPMPAAAAASDPRGRSGSVVVGVSRSGARVVLSAAAQAAQAAAALLAAHSLGVVVPFGARLCGPLPPPSFALPAAPLAWSFLDHAQPQPARRFFRRVEDTDVTWMDASAFATLHLAAAMRAPYMPVPPETPLPLPPLQRFRFAAAATATAEAAGAGLGPGSAAVDSGKFASGNLSGGNLSGGNGTPVSLRSRASIASPLAFDSSIPLSSVSASSLSLPRLYHARNCAPGYLFPARSVAVVAVAPAATSFSSHQQQLYPSTPGGLSLASQQQQQPSAPALRPSLVHAVVTSPFYSFFASSWHEPDFVAPNSPFLLSFASSSIVSPASSAYFPLLPARGASRGSMAGGLGSPAGSSSHAQLQQRQLQLQQQQQQHQQPLFSAQNQPLPLLPFAPLPHSTCACTLAAANAASAAAAAAAQRALQSNAAKTKQAIDIATSTMSALLGEGRGMANGAGDTSGRNAAPLLASAANAAAASSSSSSSLSLVSTLSNFGVMDSGAMTAFGGGSGGNSTSESAAAEAARFEAQMRAIDAAAAARRASVPEPRAAAAHVSIGVFWGTYISRWLKRNFMVQQCIAWHVFSCPVCSSRCL